MNISVITGPETEPLSLSEVKNHLRVEHIADDDLITALIIASREWVENFLHRAMITQTWKLTVDHFPHKPLRLPGNPIQEIESITYIDSDGETGTVDSTNYYLTDSGLVARTYDGEWPTVTFKGPESVYIQYVCGFADADSVPRAIKQAMLLLIGGWYEQKETPDVVYNLLWPYREVLV